MEKGSKHTKKAIKNMIKAQGHRSEVTREKMGISMRGKQHSKTTKLKMSKSHKGLNTWSKGRKLSAKTCRKMGLSRKGPKNPAWKGGISSKHDKLRSSAKLGIWRKRVFARDNYICQKCGQRGYRLNAHHIFNFTEYPSLRRDINNGITFCEKCHRRFHRLYGTYYNTPEQVLEFMENK